MNPKLRISCTLVLLLSVAMFASTRQQQDGSRSKDYQSASQKINHVHQNAQTPNPDRAPTVFTAAEINAFLAEGVTLPAGVQDVRFQFRPAVVEANLRVDFDKLATARQSRNPLMRLFTGIHDVDVIAQAMGSSGIASVRVERVEIDGVPVPKAALEYFVDHYLRPKYGEYASLNPQFRMPLRIDMVVFGQNSATVYQR